MTSKEIFDTLVCPVNCNFGAPMGRSNNLPRKNFTYPEFNDLEAVWEGVPFFDRRVKMSCDGVYDKGGAYWGHDSLRVRYSKDGINWQFYEV